MDQHEKVSSGEMLSVVISLTQLIRSKYKENKVSNLEMQKTFLSELMKCKIDDIKLFEQHIDMITQGIKNLDSKLRKEKTVLGPELYVSSALPSLDDLPGPSGCGLQSTTSIPSSSQDLIEECSSLLLV